MVDSKQAKRVVQLMVLSAWADGHVEGSEALTIQRICTHTPLLGGVGPISEISRDTRARLSEEGMDDCLIDAARALKDREYKELAFQCCAKVMGADSVFAVEEEEVLRKLQELFALGASDMKRLLVLATR